MTLLEEQHRFLSSLYKTKRPAEESEGMQIYRKNLIFGLRNVLRETYPFCRALIGNYNFNYYCREYIYRYPSKDSDLNVYGENFYTFLGQQRELSQPLESIARLEWAIARVFYSPEEPSLQDSDIQEWLQKDLSQITCRPKRSVICWASPYKILEAYKEFLDSERLAESFELQLEPLVVFQHNGRAEFQLIETSLLIIVEGLKSGNSFGEILGRPIFKDDPTQFQNSLQRLLSLGWLTHS